MAKLNEPGLCFYDFYFLIARRLQRMLFSQSHVQTHGSKTAKLHIGSQLFDPAQEENVFSKLSRGEGEE